MYLYDWVLEGKVVEFDNAYKKVSDSICPTHIFKSQKAVFYIKNNNFNRQVMFIGIIINNYEFLSK